VDGPETDEADGGAAKRGRQRRTSGQRRLPPVAYFVAAGVVVLVAVVAIAATAFLSGDGEHRSAGTSSARIVKNVPGSGPVPTAYSQAASTPAFGAISAQSKDHAPLTSAEVFGDKKIDDADAKAGLRLTASKLDSRCTAAVWGPRLAGQLLQGRCTQVARAQYTDKHFAALVTIFNLADARGADQVVATADPRAANGFPLVPPGAAAMGQSFGTARGVAMGHYAVITWVQRTDGSGDESDPALLSLLVSTGRPNAVLVRAAGPGGTR
jgi:hypothetical protein